MLLKSMQFIIFDDVKIILIKGFGLYKGLCKWSLHICNIFLIRFIICKSQVLNVKYLRLYPYRI